MCSVRLVFFVEFLLKINNLYIMWPKIVSRKRRLFSVNIYLMLYIVRGFQFPTDVKCSFLVWATLESSFYRCHLIQLISYLCRLANWKTFHSCFYLPQALLFCEFVHFLLDYFTRWFFLNLSTYIHLILKKKP